MVVSYKNTHSTLADDSWGYLLTNALLSSKNGFRQDPFSWYLSEYTFCLILSAVPTSKRNWSP